MQKLILVQGECSVNWTTDFTKITQVRHFAKDEWETSDSIRFFIEMQNKTEYFIRMLGLFHK